MSVFCLFRGILYIPVSYTNLDVYKRQMYNYNKIGLSSGMSNSLSISRRTLRVGEWSRSGTSQSLTAGCPAVFVNGTKYIFNIMFRGFSSFNVHFKSVFHELSTFMQYINFEDEKGNVFDVIVYKFLFIYIEQSTNYEKSIAK